jgi:hypothetical protein
MTPCFNEVENARGVYEQVGDVFAKLEGYRYEHIFIDNASVDGHLDGVRILADLLRGPHEVVHPALLIASG